jgi:hypothetical protein
MRQLPVGPGTTMLTRPCDSHGLRPTGENDLAIMMSPASSSFHRPAALLHRRAADKASGQRRS